MPRVVRIEPCGDQLPPAPRPVVGHGRGPGMADRAHRVVVEHLGPEPGGVLAGVAALRGRASSSVRGALARGAAAGPVVQSLALRASGGWSARHQLAASRHRSSTGSSTGCGYTCAVGSSVRFFCGRVNLAPVCGASRPAASSAPQALEVGARVQRPVALVPAAGSQQRVPVRRFLAGPAPHRPRGDAHLRWRLVRGDEVRPVKGAHAAGPRPKPKVCTTAGWSSVHTGPGARS